MGQKKWGRRVLWISSGLLVLGGLFWWRLSDSKVSYSGSSANPGFTSGSVIALAKARRPSPPALLFQAEDGRQLSSGSFTGQVVLVNLWATWCPPCVAEMPDFNQLQRMWRGKPFQVVAVSVDRGGLAVSRRWLQGQGLNDLALYNGNAAIVPDGVLPTSYLLDKQGRVAWMGVGMQNWLGQTTQETIDSLLAE